MTLRNSLDSTEKKTDSTHPTIEAAAKALFNAQYLPNMRAQGPKLNEDMTTDPDERNFLLACFTRMLGANFIYCDFSHSIIERQTPPSDYHRQMLQSSLQLENAISDQFDVAAFIKKYHIDAANIDAKNHLGFVFKIGSIYPQYVVDYIQAQTILAKNELPTKITESVLAIASLTDEYDYRKKIAMTDPLLQAKLHAPDRANIKALRKAIVLIEKTRKAVRAEKLAQDVRRQEIEADLAAIEIMKAKEELIARKETQLALATTQFAFATAQLSILLKKQLDSVEVRLMSALLSKTGCQAALENKDVVFSLLFRADRYVVENPNQHIIEKSASIRNKLMKIEKALTLISICENVFQCQGKTGFFSTPNGLGLLKQKLKPVQDWLATPFASRSALSDQCIDSVLTDVRAILNVKRLPYQGCGERSPLTDACYLESAALIDRMDDHVKPLVSEPRSAIEYKR